MSQRVTLFAIVEGQSESGFLKPFLAEHLADRGVDLHVPVIGSGSGKGGMKFRSFNQVCEELSDFLADRRKPWVTTFLDYYGLPTGTRLGWDFVPTTKAARGVEGIEDRLLTGVRAIDGRSAGRFLPYIQLHEFEALYFADPETLARVLEAPTLAERFARIVRDCGGCEQINDSPHTAPSKRIEQLCPQYIKGRSTRAHAPRLGAQLDIRSVRAHCPRFDVWLTRLEGLATGPDV